MDSKAVEVKIIQFDPLQVQVPDEGGEFFEAKITLPSIKLNLIDLSMGGVIPGGPHIGTEAEALSVMLTQEEPILIGTVIEIIRKIKPELKELHARAQKVATEYGPLCEVRY